MGIAPEVKKLTEDILAAYDARLKSLETLRDEVAKLINDYKLIRQELGKKIKTELTENMHHRQEEVKEFRENLANVMSKRQEEVKRILSSIRDDLNEAATAWQELAMAKQKRGSGK